MYKRFINNNDYISIVTEEALSQLIRGNVERLAQAEEAAEESILEYLSGNYEIEKVLAVGKDLLEYNTQITYPAGAHFYHNNKIYKALRTIRGRKAPTSVVYWTEADTLTQSVDTIKPYSQRLSYAPGDIITFAGKYYECVEHNGLDFNNVQVPGLTSWVKIDTDEWIVNLTYNKWDVVRYDGSFYALINPEDVDWNLNPYDSDNWGKIGDYDAYYNEYELSDTEFVVYENEVYYPIAYPNSDELVLNHNIIQDDPRNANIKKHLLRLAIYELYKLTAPVNISSTRVTDYETSILWLRDAARLKINPQIPRKVAGDNKHVTEYAIATYARDYDPYKNPWQI
jgi:hypothetical protein